ncbi:hypothetical protein CKO15_06090 [Halorhodospira abdelmalekii]|uniref:hypothetical protein n=1 Tax=Halorhodospira abdelmalekii TaxID=421629 RepID=UPI0019044DEC|nr:hypothetical protein [Halorhodospira abdelmalekii]MBK1734866.1 hypothetical protein [Halorhodospira abdelmalekii]
MTIRLNDCELERLCSSRLSHAARLAYVLVIRPAMDYATGFSGQRRTISYQQLREVLEYTPPAGSQRREIRYSTRQQLRALLAEIEREGLVQRLRTSDRGLVFRCCLADTDECASTRNNPGATPEQPQRRTPGNNPISNPDIRRYNSELKPTSNPRSTPRKPPDLDPLCSARNDPPPESGIREENTTHIEAPDLRRDERAHEAHHQAVCDPQERIDETPAPSSTTGDRFAFERFWTTYPQTKRKKKKKAYDVFRQDGLGRYIDRILKDVEQRQQEDRRWIAGYIPDPDNYLRDRRWEEALERGRFHGALDIRPTSNPTGAPGGTIASARTFGEAGFNTSPDW